MSFKAFTQTLSCYGLNKESSQIYIIYRSSHPFCILALVFLKAKQLKMIIKTLENVTNIEVLDVFNDSFSDYSIPFKLTIEQLNSKIESEGIDFSYSVGAFKDEKLVGFILHGIKETDDSLCAYNAGTGVIPSERGQKLTVKMYEFIIPFLKSNNVSEIVLEVLSDNNPAIRSYKKVGFKIIRKLNCFKGEITERSVNPNVTIKLIDNPVLDQLCTIGEIQPTWQNSKETIEESGSDIKVYGAYYNNKLIGYCTLNAINNRLQQIAVAKDNRRRNVGSTLLDHIRTYVSANVSIINVDARFESINLFFEKNGLSNFLQQYEMSLHS